MKGAQDQQAQVDAYEAAMDEIVKDTHIAEVFLWGWSNTGLFDIHGTKAVGVINKIYSSSKI